MVGGNGLAFLVGTTHPFRSCSTLDRKRSVLACSYRSIAPWRDETNLAVDAGPYHRLCWDRFLIGPAEFTGGTMQFDMIGILVCLLAAFFWSFGSILQPHSRSAEISFDDDRYGNAVQGVSDLFILATLTGEWQNFSIAAISQKSTIWFDLP